MKYFISGHNHEKYRPTPSLRQRFFSRLKPRQHDATLTGSKSNSTNNWHNPYRHHLPNTKHRLMIWLLIIIMIAWLGIILYLPYFQINQINVEGLKIIKSAEIEDCVSENYLNKYLIIPGSNYFLISEGRLAKELAKNLAIQTIVVKKIFPHELSISIEEKISSIIYDDGRNYHLLDQNGKVIKLLAPVYLEKNFTSTTDAVVTSSPTPTTNASSSTSTTLESKKHIPDYTKIQKEFGGLPILYDMRTTAAGDDRVLPGNIVMAVINATREVRVRGIGDIKYFILNNPLAGLEAVTDKGWSFYFNSDETVAKRIENLKNIIKDNQPKEYIDLRYGDRIYSR